jgi:hypothetical protein
MAMNRMEGEMETVARQNKRKQTANGARRRQALGSEEADMCHCVAIIGPGKGKVAGWDRNTEEISGIKGETNWE